MGSASTKMRPLWGELLRCSRSLSLMLIRSCWRCGEAGLPRCVLYAVVILVEICTMRGCVATAAIKFLLGGISSLLSRVKESRIIMLHVLSQREREEREILGRKKLPTTMVLGTIILLQLLLLLHLFLRTYSKREL